MGVSNTHVTITETDWNDFLPTCFQVGSGPGVGKVFKLCKFVMRTKVLPLPIPKLSNMLTNEVSKVGAGEEGFGINAGGGSCMASLVI